MEKTIESIKKGDLNTIFGKSESLELEFKEIDTRIISKDDRKEKILKPLVSFLNSSKGSGLLILGIKEGRRDVASDLVGVKPNILNQLQSEGSLETLLMIKLIQFHLKVKNLT